MKENNYLRIFSGVLLIMFVISLTACNTSHNYFKKDYRKVWKETIQSASWINSFNSTSTLSDKLIEDVIFEDDNYKIVESINIKSRKAKFDNVEIEVH